MVAANTSYKCNSTQDSLISLWIILEISFSRLPCTPSSHSQPITLGHMKRNKTTEHVFSPHIAVPTQSRGADLKTGSVKFFHAGAILFHPLCLPGFLVSFFILLSFFLEVPRLQELIFFFLFSGEEKKPHLHLQLFAKSQKPCLVVPTSASGTLFASEKMYVAVAT